MIASATLVAKQWYSVAQTSAVSFEGELNITPTCLHPLGLFDSVTLSPMKVIPLVLSTPFLLYL